ncbi:MAG: PEP-CTERM sorting domain-containing protein [Akkermansia sp.]|nr:PEP-CTERM sorting domain-containing protein [Akkermansia sp.]
MKATLTTLLALAMLSGTAFAGIYTPTVVDGIGTPDAPYYYGVYSESAPVNANVTIREDASGTTQTDYYIWGGYSEGDDYCNADYNTVTMTGGQVHDIIVGEVWFGGASNNTLVMTGGIADSMVEVAANYYENDGQHGEVAHVDNNVAILTGGNVDGDLIVAYGYGDSTVNNNQLHLVGAGAGEVSIGGVTYEHTDDISLGDVAVAKAGEGVTAENNSIDIYGAGIEATGLSGFDQLNFHIVDGLTTTGTPMVSVTGELDLTQLTASINLFGDAVTDWNAFEGQEITLAHADSGIVPLNYISKDGENYNILDASGATVATALLRLTDGTRNLVMSNVQGVPEPTTGTLSLLALAGLCIRRRK